MEQVPDKFRETRLMPLYKRKGDRKEVSSQRFLHLKSWPAKLYEKLFMQRLEVKIRRATAELQEGGQPGGSCIDHLISMVTTINMMKKKKMATVLTLTDIVKCFDQCKLSDIEYELTKAGIAGIFGNFP